MIRQTTGSGEDGQVKAEWTEITPDEARALMMALGSGGPQVAGGVTGEETPQ